MTEHLYIHWPFCHSKCHFCDFIAFAQHYEFFDIYHEALCKEIELFSDTLSNKNKKPVKTIFFGGGTPSIYPNKLFFDLFVCLKKHFDLSSVQEITLESNPIDINKNSLELWKSLGINRLSMGVQILDDTILARLKRTQTVQDVYSALSLASNFFSNISVDLIIGLPGVTNTIWENTIKTLINFNITHISLYFLTIHEKTPLYFNIARGIISLPSDEQAISQYLSSISFLEKQGFFQYEISNFSKVGYESKHNLAYWNRCPYRGFGISASSFDGVARFTNIKNLEKYLNTVLKEKILPVENYETLNQQDILIETLMLGMRQKRGVDLHSVLYLLVGNKKDNFLTNLSRLKAEQLVDELEGRITFTTKGMLLENEVIIRLI
jgi:oxygen-independent coproporphyrinogen-3 oxidase